MSDELVILWEAPKIEPPEFRLYHDDKGNVVCYTCQKLEGNYIVIDSLTYAAARPDIRVIDGKISTVAPSAVVYKLMPSDEGMACAKEDISIISDGSIETTKWKLKIYEL
jgi:hypothetical protein